jgi:hypothetical protein
LWEACGLSISARLCQDLDGTSRPGGGPCRAYLSQELLKGRTDFAVLHEDHRQIRDENGDAHSDLVRRGLAATISSRAGNLKPFGKTAAPLSKVSSFQHTSPAASGADGSAIVLFSDKSVATHAWVDTISGISVPGLRSPHQYQEQALSIWTDVQASTC